MPFYGPLSLGGFSVDEGRNTIQRLFPGASGITSFPGQGGVGTAALGFSHGGPPLFAGQPPSSLDSLVSSRPNLVEGISVQPESITGAIAGATTPTLGATYGGDTGAGISSGTEAGSGFSLGGFSIDGSNATGGHNTAQMGNPQSVIGNIVSGHNQIQESSPVGRMAAHLGINPTLATTALGIAGNAVPGGGLLSLGNTIASVVGGKQPASPQTVSGLMDVVNAMESMVAPNEDDPFGVGPPGALGGAQTGLTLDAANAAAGIGVGSGSGIPGLTDTAAVTSGQVSPAPVSAVTGQPGQPGYFSNDPQAVSPAPVAPADEHGLGGGEAGVDGK